MDLKLKSKFWTRNIYHQFESICQDVDDLMSKDTMKYVENHVQSVGVSVKRFCNVVQDILPLSKDDAKPKAQSKQVDMKDHISSVTGIVEKPTCVDEKQLYVEQGFIDTKSPSVDHSQEPKSYLHLSEDGDAICNEADNCFEDNITRESIPWTTDSISENQIFPVTYDEDHKASLPTLSANEAGLLSIEKEKTSCYGLSNDAESSSDISSTDLSSKDNILLFEDPMFSENRSLSVPSLSLFDNVDEDKSPVMDSSLPLVFDASPRVLGEDEILSNKIPIHEDPDSIENKSSYVSSDSSSDKVREDNRVLMDSPLSSAIGVVPAFSILESNDNNASPIDGSIPAVDSSESSQEQHSMDALSNFALSPETGKTDKFGDSNMETVDLSSNGSHDERSVTTCFNGNFGYAASSYRRRNLRYYKKLIQEALGSRKRISKEYEHLAIMYGDIDAESRQYFEPSCSRTGSFQEICETEWELI